MSEFFGDGRRNDQPAIKLGKDDDGLAKNEVTDRASVRDHEAHWFPKILARLRRSSSSICGV